MHTEHIPNAFYMQKKFVEKAAVNCHLAFFNATELYVYRDVGLWASVYTCRLRALMTSLYNDAMQKTHKQAPQLGLYHLISFGSALLLSRFIRIVNKIRCDTDAQKMPSNQARRSLRGFIARSYKPLPRPVIFSC